MTFTQFISILRARWWVVALVTVLTVGTAVTVSLLLPKKYTAEASVVVDVKPDPVTAMLYPGLASPSYIATQVDIMTSDRVAQRVARTLKLADNPEIRQQWLDATKGEGDINVWLADTLQASLDVKPSKESNVITVSYKAPDPRFAAGLANAFVQAYLDTSLELRVDPAKKYSSFFDTRAKEARDAVEKSQTRLSGYQKEKGIIATDERLDIETSRLNELSSQLVMLQSVASESSSRQAQALGASGDKLQEVLTNPVIGNLKAELNRAETSLQQLNSRLGDNHPQVVEARASIAELRSRLDAETKRVTGGVGVTSNINRQREAEVRSALEAQRTKVLRMKALRDEGSVLARDLDNAQRAYDAVLARLNQSSLESQNTQSNVFMLTQATAPTDPSSPKVLLNTAAALVVGLLLAVGIAMLLEMADRRVRSVDDAAIALGLPVLGIMPRPNARRLFRRDSVPLLQQRLLAALPSANKSS